MTTPNGHANGSATASTNGAEAAAAFTPVTLARTPDGFPRFTSEETRQLIAELQVPFDRSVIEWRVTNTSHNKVRGQVIPYADQRAYTDRLNALFTPAGWTREYAVHTSASFERSKDKKVVAKVLVTCKLTVHGLGSHSATGEEWADDDNATTSAEAQSFKRTCSCFGLGRYLYYFQGIWVDLDDRKRPRSIPQLFGWATPEGWRRGLRPWTTAQNPATGTAGAAPNQPHRDRGEPSTSVSNSDLVHKIEAMADPIGKRLYRGLLKTIARAWQPGQIGDRALLERVLQHMQAAERGIKRLDAALDRIGPEPLGAVLESLQLESLNQVDSLATLHKIVLTMEAKADLTQQ